MKAHVICCNDAVQHVVIGDEEAARIKLHELRRIDFAKNVPGAMTEKEYMDRMYWHLLLVPMSVSQEPLAYIGLEAGDNLQGGFNVLTMLTKHRAFPSDVPLYTTKTSVFKVG